MNELINVLRSNRGMIRIELESKNTNASEFWFSLTCDVCGLIPADYLKVCDSMKSFQEVDSLELVNKQGKLLKRFAKHFKESNGYKLDDKLAGLIGDKLQYYLSKESKVYYVDFTDVINWRDGQFGKQGSCWWGQYSDSQEAFISNGGWGIRFYENEEDKYGIGRTWIYPKDGMLMCFNSYGVERPNVSKVIKQVYKQSGIILHYKTVELSNSGNSEIPYINSGTGFVLFPEGIDPASLDESYDLEIKWESESRYHCCNCGDSLDEDETYLAEDDIYCEYCYSDIFSSCEKCGDTYRHEDLHRVNGWKRYEVYLCRYCLESVDASECYHCEEYHVNGIVTEDTGEFYCEDCKDSHCTYCEKCDEWNRDECENHEEDSDDEVINETPVETESDIIHTQENLPHRNRDVSGMDTSQVLKVWRLRDNHGLCVNNDPNKNVTLYSITHELSGLAVFHCNHLAQALTSMRELYRIADCGEWMLPPSLITFNTEFIEKVLTIKREYS